MAMIIEKFRKTDLFICFAITSAFSRDYNDVLYLRHKTFYKLLSQQGKTKLDYLYKRYKLDLTSTNDPLSFVNYLSSLRNSDDFMIIRMEVDSIINSLMQTSRLTGVLEADLRYVVRCYYREDDNAAVYSIFEDTHFNALTKANITFTDLRHNENIVKILRYLKQKDSYDYNSLKACVKKVCNNDNKAYFDAMSALLSLMIYVVFSACKTKPKRFTWSDIINQLYGESNLFDQEVFDLCYV